MNDYYRELWTDASSTQPWRMLFHDIQTALPAATRLGETAQAASIAETVHEYLLPRYQRFHRDLLAHLANREDLLFQPFFLARCYEAALAQGPPWNEYERIADGAIHQLNDFLGHRPVAVLENRRGIQPYAHERLRPIPLYIRGVGAGVGKYQSLIAAAVDVLQSTNPAIRASAGMDVDLLDELAVDPRAYDHSHPVNLRPGYQFGEWDPHCMDNQGRYRRFIVRMMILDALVEWTTEHGQTNPREAHFEAAAALAGTILLASGVSGWGPGAHGSDVSLTNLMGLVARYRDAFYAELLQQIEGSHGQRLREQAKQLRQPLGGVRTFLNHYVARCRAEQLVRDRLALLYTRIGFVDSGRRQADRIDIPSTRMRTEIECRVVVVRQSLADGRLSEILERLAEAEDLLHRAIECGAMLDPRNILGFQGNFNRFQSLEDSVVDARVDVLLATMQDLFDLHSAALRECAAAGDSEVAAEVDRRFQRLADWWDKFAAYEVDSVRRVRGADALDAARFVANSLRDWRESGEYAGNVSFWRRRADEFKSPQSFSLVVDALLARRDYVSSMALMMQWLSQNDSVPLENGGYSFHELVLRWMVGVVDIAASGEKVPSKSNDAPIEPAELVAKFFDFLEVNAGDLWRVPGLLADSPTDAESLAADTDDELFAAAYEGVTFRGQSDDGVDAPLAGGGDTEGDFSPRANEIARRLQFLATLARLWLIAAWGPWRNQATRLPAASLDAGIEMLQANKRNLFALLDEIDAFAVPAPSSSLDSIIEFERIASVKDAVTARATHVAMETSHALRSLVALRGEPLAPSSRDSIPMEDWETQVVRFEASVLAGDAQAAHQNLKNVLAALESAPLMYVPPDKGGKVRDVCVARYARDVLRMLAVQLPSTADFEGTYNLLETVLDLEHRQSAKAGQSQVSEFDMLYRVAFRSLMTRLVEQLGRWPQTKDDDKKTTFIVGKVVARFSQLWAVYVGSVRFSEIERRSHARDWLAVTRFIQKYGGDLFTQAFMTEGNLHAILHHGAKSYLERRLAEPDGPTAGKLLADIESGAASIDEAADLLDFVARSVLERYRIYKDYNVTTPQSDYGDNLHLLLELLRVLVDYERRRWALEPGYIGHQALVRRGRLKAGRMLREAFRRETTPISEQLQARLAEAEAKCGFRLPTVSAEIAEGFLGQLRLDQMLALAEQSLTLPAAESRRAFRALTREVERFASNMRGSGIDTPEWLARLEAAVERILDVRAGKPPDFEDLALARHIPIDLSYDDFREDIDEWDEE